MNGGNPELNVELRLKLEKAQADAAKGAAQIKNTMGGVFKQTVDPATLAAQKAAIQAALAGGKTAKTAIDKLAKDGEKYAIAASRTNIRELNRAARVAEKSQMDGSKLNIKLKQNDLKEQLRQQRQAESQALAASRINIREANRAAKEAEKNQLNAARTNIRMAMSARREEEAAQRRAERQALDGSRLQIRLNNQRNRDNERAERERERRNRRFASLTEAQLKNFSMLSGVTFSPGGGLTTMFAARQVFQGLRERAAQQRLMGGQGQSIGMSAGITAGLIVGATALGFALKGLAVTANKVIEAYEKQSRIYAKSLSSGLSIGFVQRRTILANIMGVSEEEVIRFGKAMEYLNPKIAIASKALAESTIPLTQVQWAFKVLGYDMEALFAKIAQGAAPAIIKMVNGIDLLVKSLLAAGDFLVRFGKEGIKFAIEQMLQNMFGAMGGKVAELLLGKVSGLFGKLGTASSANMPAPQSYMKQLGASSLERMGLVMGIGGGNNPNHETAKNTKRTVQVLERIDRILSSTKGGLISPAQSYR